MLIRSSRSRGGTASRCAPGFYDLHVRVLVVIVVVVASYREWGLSLTTGSLRAKRHREGSSMGFAAVCFVSFVAHLWLIENVSSILRALSAVISLLRCALFCVLKSHGAQTYRKMSCNHHGSYMGLRAYFCPPAVCDHEHPPLGTPLPKSCNGANNVCGVRTTWITSVP